MGEMNTSESAREKLLKDMKRTKGVRFNASKRIEENERKTTRNTAYASVAVIVVTLLPVFFPMGQVLENAVALTTVALSIFILASSLLQSAHAGQVKADQFQRCALEVNSLRRELSAAPEDVDLGAYSGRYDEILRRYNINHDQVDYDQYRLEHPDEFPTLAPEETKNARSNIANEGKFSELAAKAIAVATLGMVLAAATSSTTLFQEIYQAIVDWLQSAASK